MKAIAKQINSGKTVYVIGIESTDNLSSFDSQGLCIACGEFADGVEPDARRYECESCEQNKVYGIEELILMGYTTDI
jgi:hypothetical protein